MHVKHICMFFEDLSGLKALPGAKVVPNATVVDNTLVRHVFSTVGFQARPWHVIIIHADLALSMVRAVAATVARDLGSNSSLPKMRIREWGGGQVLCIKPEKCIDFSRIFYRYTSHEYLWPHEYLWWISAQKLPQNFLVFFLITLLNLFVAPRS